MKRILSVVATLVAWGGIVQSQNLDLMAGAMDLNQLEGQKIEVVDSFYYRLDSAYTYTSNGGGWVLDSRSNYQYDGNNNLVNYVFQFYESGAWKNGKKVEYSYAQGSSMLKTQTLRWDDAKGDWEYVWRKSYQQDINNSNLVVVYSEWETTSEKWLDKWQQMQSIILPAG